MAFGGSLSPGGSYGRIQVILNWVQDNWQHFDSWCCVKNIDPLELSAYRFYNLALMLIREDLNDEDPEVQAKQLENLEDVLNTCDQVEHALLRLGAQYRTPQIIQVVKGQTKVQVQAQPEAKPEDRHKYIPPWWQGEERAYKNAQAAMGGISTLPKMQT